LLSVDTVVSMVFVEARLVVVAEPAVVVVVVAAVVVAVVLEGSDVSVVDAEITARKARCQSSNWA
jgi:hypothetical protein